MKVVYDPTILTPVLTASSTSTGSGNTPDRAADGDTTTFWESNPETNPYIQIDLTRVMRVYQIDILWDSVEVPASFQIQSSDAPTDTTYGLVAGTAFDLVFSGAGVASTSTSQAFDAKSARYWRIAMQGTGQMRIKEITVWADIRYSETSARALVGSTYFSEANNTLLSLQVKQAVSKMIWEATLKLDNKNQRYDPTAFPNGTVVKIWYEGKVSFLGTIVNVDFVYDVQGLSLTFTCRDYGEFLNQTIREVDSGVRVSDTGGQNDVISRGPYSILAHTVDSAGTRIIGNTGVTPTLFGVNDVSYLKAPDTDATQILNKIVDTIAIDGAWIIQNGAFNIGAITPTNIGNHGLTDGEWYAFSKGDDITQTAGQFSVSLRDGTPASPLSAGTLDITNVYLNATLQSSGNDIRVPTPDQTPLQPAGTFVYDGSINAEGGYNYAELFQPVFFSLAQCSQASSFAFSIFTGGNQKLGSGSNVDSQVTDTIIETTNKFGQIRRLHYLATLKRGTIDNGSGTSTIAPMPSDTLTDSYIYAPTLPTNIYSDYTNKFGTASDDVVTAIRLRCVPLGDPTTVNAVVESVSIADIAVSVVPGVKVPPVRWDWYVDPTSGSPQLAFFPRPRPGVDLTYRHLDSSNNLRFFSTFPASEKNNVIKVNYTHSDAYRVKNDVSISGEQLKKASGDTIDASTNNLAYQRKQSPPHGSKFPVVRIADTVAQSQTGRRPYSNSVKSSDPAALAREAINTLNNMKDAEQRGVLECRGNPNLQPGFVVKIDSDYSVLNTFFYITNADHVWDENGYKTTITIAEDRLRFSNEFARLNVGVLQAQLKSVIGESATTTQYAYGKTNADISQNNKPTQETITSLNVTGGPQIQTGGQSGFVLPLNALIPFSVVRNVQFTVTKALDRKGVGQVSPIDFSGWETENTVNLTGGSEITVSAQQWLAQRVFLPAQSVGSVILRYKVRKPTSNANGDSLQVAAFNEGSITLLGITYPTPGALIPNITDTDGLASKDGWVQIPFVNVLASGGVGNSGNPTNVDHFAEIHFAAPVGNPAGIGSAGQISGTVGAVFWAVFRTTGATVNFNISRTVNPGVASQFALWSQQAGNGWQTLFTGDSIGSGAMVMAFRPSAALDSVGTNTPDTDGNGNGLYAVDPASGTHYPFVPVPGSSRQTQSRVVFPTAIVARTNSSGDVGVGFICSAGRGSVNGDQIVRLDYQAKIDYIAF